MDSKNQEEIVIFIHGLFGTLDMRQIAKRYRKEGYKTYEFDYKTNFLKPPYFTDTKAIAERLKEEFGEVSKGYKKIHFVCHSMGGLILLHMLKDNPGITPASIVFHGTPFQGSPVAEYLYYPELSFFEDFKPGKQLKEHLQNLNEQIMGTVGKELSVTFRKENPLPFPNCPTGIIIGDTGGIKYAWTKPFFDLMNAGINDGLVSHNSAMIDGSDICIIHGANHDTTLGNSFPWIKDSIGIQQTLHFTKHSIFDKSLKGCSSPNP